MEMKLEKNYFTELNTNILLNLTDNPTQSKGKNRNYDELVILILSISRKKILMLSISQNKN